MKPRKKKKLFVSSHAAFRWAQRIDRSVPAGQLRLTPDQHYRAVSRVLSARRHARRLSPRIVSRLMGGTRKKWPKGSSYWMTTDALLVIKSGRVITVLRWGLDPFVTVMIHDIFGIWPEGPQNFARL